MKGLAKLLGIAVLAVAPMTANAAVIYQLSNTGTSLTMLPAAAAPVNTTIVAPETYTESILAFGTDSFEYNYTALTALTVLGVSFTANGRAADVAKVSLSFDGAPFASFVPVGNVNASTGEFSFGGFSLGAGEKFSFTLNYNGVVAPVLANAFFQTAVIPVPAALPLMLGGIAALGAVARKKKNNA